MQPVIQRAVELSRTPNSQTRNSGAGYSQFRHEDSATTADGDGFTIHDFMVDVDALDDPNAALT